MSKRLNLHHSGAVVVEIEVWSFSDFGFWTFEPHLGWSTSNQLAATINELDYSSSSH
jgi:hypothetical protein